MDTVRGLQELGMTEYEARVYTSLVGHPGSTGYELAKHSGVPRAKIYEVLNALTGDGNIMTSVEGERMLYHPLPYQTLLDRHMETTQRTVTELGSALAELSTPPPEAPLVTVRGYDAIIQRAEHIIADAKDLLLVTGQAPELERLSGSLAATEARGVAVHVLTYGPAALDLKHVYQHGLVRADNRVGAIPVLVVVADHAEALLAEAAPTTGTTGLWTRQRGVATVAAEFIKHDIFVVEIVRRHPEMAGDRLADLQSLWFRLPEGR